MALVGVGSDGLAMDAELKQQSAPRCGQFYRRRRPEALRVEPIQTKICGDPVADEDRKKDSDPRQIKWGSRKKIKYAIDREENLQIVVQDSAKSLLKVPKEMHGRWSNERYTAAQESLVLILHEKKAIPGYPLSRQALREEARKFIGDTGLLDHLLKHMSDRVVVNGERLRRCHNADGGMEYWLEPANFMELRKIANVSDPFWIPPSGWKKGDPVVTNVADEIRVLRVDVDGLRSEIHRSQKSSTDSEAVKYLKQEVETLRSELKQLQGKPADRIDALDVQIRKLLEEAKLRQELQIVEKLTLDAQYANMWKTIIAMQEKLTSMERSESSRYQQRSVYSPCVKESPGEQQHGFKLCRPPGTFLMPPASTPIGPSLRVEDILSPRSSDSDMTIETSSRSFADPIARQQMFLTAAVQALQDNCFDGKSPWLGTGSPEMMIQSPPS